MHDPTTENKEDVQTIEIFIILLYNRMSSEKDINQARKALFCQKGRSIENIPPTKAALVQHIKWAIF